MKSILDVFFLSKDKLEEKKQQTFFYAADKKRETDKKTK